MFDDVRPVGFEPDDVLKVDQALERFNAAANLPLACKAHDVGRRNTQPRCGFTNRDEQWSL
jgi:hypothetical protein